MIFPTGALPDPVDERDYKLSELMGGSPHPPVDWDTPFEVPEPPDSDQAQADCCVGEGTSYYHWQLKGKKFSVRSVFAYIAQQYGAYIRDGVKRVVEFGQETLEECQDPHPKTPSNMRSKDGLNPADALDDKEYDYFQIDWNTIDAVAYAVKEYKGVVFGITGSNPGFADHAFPRPPKPGEETWGHCLYVMGYKKIDGKKYLICKSSWCSSGVTRHHISEDFFPNYTFSAWTLIPKTMNQAKVVKSKTSQTVFVCYPVPSMEFLATKADLEGFTVPTEIPNTDTLI